ncbi:MAG: S8 family serine peptidase [Planctomycetota bacterium]
MKREYGLTQIHTIIQLTHIPDKAKKVQLRNLGIELLSYIPNNAWYAAITLPAESVARQKEIRWVGSLKVDDKIAPKLLNDEIGNWAINPDGTISLQVIFFEDVSQDLAYLILNKYCSEIAGPGMLNDWTVKMSKSLLMNLAAEDSVKWISEITPPPVPLNHVTRAAVYVNEVEASGMSGDGVKVGIWDYGNIIHDDLDSRVTQVQDGGWGEHSVMVAAVLGGDGSLSESEGGTPYQWRGIAPGVWFYAYTWDGDQPAEVVSAVTLYDIDLSQNSWGNCNFGTYSYKSASYDEIIHRGTGPTNKKIPVIFSAGNFRELEGCGITTPDGYFTVDEMASAKNIITVGGTYSDSDTMTTFSSWGPTNDGRLKPDVVAPASYQQGEVCNNGVILTSGIKSATRPFGTYINKCELTDYYGRKEGTSFSSPVVSGAIALMLERHRQLFGSASVLLPSTYKSILIHSAKDLGNPGPDYEFGYGRINIEKAICLLEDDEYLENTIHSQGDENEIVVNIGSIIPEFKVTLAWDDFKGDPSLDKQLINDLDLVAIDPTGIVHLPWSLDPGNPANPATIGEDHINNVEQVIVANPLIGQWTIRVKGTTIPESPQTYSLVKGNVLPIRTSGAIPEYNSDLQAAYDVSNEGDIIESQAEVFNEDLFIDQNKTVTLKGGNNCDFTINNGKSTLNGNMVISSGKVTIENFVLR